MVVVGALTAALFGVAALFIPWPAALRLRLECCDAR
jgi:hypothetical protein